MPKPSDKWTRDEHILAFNLYCKIPFGRQHSRAPEVMDLAKLMGRSPGSLALKLNNFSRLDPELQARGINTNAASPAWLFPSCSLPATSFLGEWREATDESTKGALPETRCTIARSAGG